MLEKLSPVERTSLAVVVAIRLTPAGAITMCPALGVIFVIREIMLVVIVV